MAEIKTVKTIDVQLLNANRERPKTYKFDNPKDNLTRAQISEAFTPALSNSWLLAADGSVAMYLGDTTLNTSTKITLDGEDFYITPNSLTFGAGSKLTLTLTVTGAQIQGYNVKDYTESSGGANAPYPQITISENGLAANVTFDNTGNYRGSFNLILIILGQEITIPCTFGT